MIISLSKFRKAILCLTFAFLTGHPALIAQNFRLYAVSDLSRVFEDGYKFPAAFDTVKVFGFRGEVISGQLVIRADMLLPSVTVRVSSLKSLTNKGILSDNVLGWNFVGSVPLSKNTPNQPDKALSRRAPARFPDILMAEREISIKPGSCQAVWLTIPIPPDAFAGTYNGSVTVSDGTKERSLPVSVTVYPFTMPSERHLRVVEWHTATGFEKFHGIKEKYSPEWFGMLRKYAENMVDHRQNIFQVPMSFIGISRSGSGNLEFDFSRFDQVADIFWSTGKMDYLETGFLANFGKGDWFSTEIILKDFSVTDKVQGGIITMKGEEVVPFLLPAFEGHLRQKGWLNKTLYHVRDEPSVHNAPAWKKMSEYIHDLAPGLIRIDAIETTFLLDDIEVAVPKLDHFGTWYDKYHEWQKERNELWFYTVGIYQGSLFPDKTIDMPLIDSRLMHWLNYRYGATGYLHWGYNQWNDDPFGDPGEHAGDAWHVYPAKNGVLNSLRWEQMRNGIQDYEYFWMLENKIRTLKDSLGSGFSWIDPGQRGREIAGEVVPAVAMHSDDPTVLYKAKMKVIKELTESEDSPRLYIQTNPPENSVLTNHSSVELMGWTEPGTKITINGSEIPVRNDGLFLEQFGGDFIDPSKIHLGDQITVKAVNPGGSKTIVRKFTIR